MAPLKLSEEKTADEYAEHIATLTPGMSGADLQVRLASLNFIFVPIFFSSHVLFLVFLSFYLLIDFYSVLSW